MAGQCAYCGEYALGALRDFTNPFVDIEEHSEPHRLGSLCRLETGGRGFAGVGSLRSEICHLCGATALIVLDAQREPWHQVPVARPWAQRQTCTRCDGQRHVHVVPEFGNLAAESSFRPRRLLATYFVARVCLGCGLVRLRVSEPASVPWDQLTGLRSLGGNCRDCGGRQAGVSDVGHGATAVLQSSGFRGYYNAMVCRDCGVVEVFVGEPRRVDWARSGEFRLLAHEAVRVEPLPLSPRGARGQYAMAAVLILVQVLGVLLIGGAVAWTLLMNG